jgi:4-oxalocrotonate tautomerase
MPLIHITLAGQPAAPATIAALQRDTTRLMRDVLHKEAALTVVAVTQLPAGSYSADGRAVRSTASLLATITAGTNNDADKAAFVAAATRMLATTIGDSDAPVYVALQELPASDWGYDGRTQAARRAERLAREAV